MCKVCISFVGFNGFVESVKGNKGVVPGFDLVDVLKCPSNLATALHSLVSTLIKET